MPLMKPADTETTDTGFKRKEVQGLTQQETEGTRFSQHRQSPNQETPESTMTGITNK